MAAQELGAGACAPSTGDGSTSNTAAPQVSVEMENLDTSNRTTNTTLGQGLLNDVSIPVTSPMTSNFPTTTSTGTSEQTPGDSNATTKPVDTAETSSPSPAAISADTEATPVVAADGGPVLIITLLLPTGARHPYKIDEKYLTKRNVNVPDMTESGKKDPFSISVYTLKELILREWREEWEAAPSSPSSIRLIYFGRLLDDKTALKGKHPESAAFPRIFAKLVPCRM